MEKLRADKYIASQLNITRSQAVKLIKSGAAEINGSVFSRPEAKLEPQSDEVTVNGIKVSFKRYIYIMMNKPQGVVSASRDSRDKTVLDLVPESLSRRVLFPAGRLDKDTTGFVLITDDGEFAHNILSPGRHIPKTYLVTLEHCITKEQEQLIREGLTVASERFLPAGITLADSENAVYEVILHEGKYHQIKRMFGSLQAPVVALHRTKMGELSLDSSLLPGDCREITTDELRLITE